MSQSRSRKAPAVGSDAGLRARPSHTKASGDTVTPHPQRQNQRSKSKSSKVPKALRYDLENALVGLCDVWFEDIKPHLLRNNIKVHVLEGDAGAGDNRQNQLPPGAPGCSHVEPATTASDCKLCRLLFNASNSIESAVSQAASASPPASLAKAFNSETTTNAGRSSVKERVRQAASPSPPKSEFIRLVPRLFHTYSIPSTISLVKRTSNYVTRPKKNDQKKKKIKKKNNATQTGHIPQHRMLEIPLNVNKSQKHFHKSRATIAFYPPRRKKSRNSGQTGSREPQPQQDEKKHVKLLYQSATKVEFPSVMNLVRSPKIQRKQVGSKTLKPWK